MILKIFTRIVGLFLGVFLPSLFLGTIFNLPPQALQTYEELERKGMPGWSDLNFALWSMVFIAVLGALVGFVRIGPFLERTVLENRVKRAKFLDRLSRDMGPRRPPGYS